MSETMVCSLRRSGRFLYNIQSKANGDRFETSLPMRRLRPKPATKAVQRGMIRGDDDLLRFGYNNTLYTCRFVTLVRHNAIWQLMMNLTAGYTTHPTDD